MSELHYFVYNFFSMKNIKLIFTLLSFFLICIGSHSCSKEPAVSLSKYERDKLEVRKKIDKAKQHTFDLTASNNVEEDCDISGVNCINFIHGLEIYVDISDCSTAVTDSCLIYGEMEITICFDNLNNMEVNFKETIIGHSIDCIQEGYGEVHTDDWDCIAEKTYLKFVDYMMPNILELWGTYNDCEDGYNTALSSYTKELCVYPCTIKRGAYYYSQLVQCGSSTACCVKKDYWCKDDEGVVHSTPGEIYQVGECSAGEVPCKPSKGDPYPVLDRCRPRNCIQHER